MKGFIYVLSNPSLSSVKIGKTNADPTQRTKDLTGSTSIPTAFKLEYSAYVDDYNAKEREIHLVLDAHRVNSKREFFDVTVAKAISTVEDICLIRYAENLAAKTISSQQINAQVAEQSDEKNLEQDDTEETSEIDIASPSQSYLQKIIHEGNGWRRGSFSFEVVPVYESTIRSWLFVVLAFPALAILTIPLTLIVMLIWQAMTGGVDSDVEFEASDFGIMFVLTAVVGFMVYTWLRLCGWLLKVDFSKLRRPKV